MQNNHKSLVPLLGSKDLDTLHMRLIKFHFTIVHVPGKNLTTADALSTALLPTNNSDYADL